ncbi:MAG: hypothetical protein J6Y35_04885 [Bacteroidales bacterium]|nr:hypothetical protein [Bacteroidales bacterium]
MLEQIISATDPLIIIGCIIIIALIIACLNVASKRKYKQKVDAVAAETKQLKQMLQIP